MSQKFVQAQPFSLAGAGAVLGATSIVLNSFNKLDGTALTMADFGAKGYCTIEPGSAENEEAITFTGITANSNGTVTLTGVKNQMTESPYTETSGISNTHVGATTLIITNTAGFYDEMTSNSNDELVTGQWTFTQSPIVPTPISASTTAAASVQYVNNIAIAGAPKAATNVFGISELSTAPVLASVPIVVGDNDTRMLTQSENDAAVGNSSSVVPSSSTNVFVTQQGFQRNQERYAVATGTSLALVVALSPTPVALIAGMQISFKSPVTTGIAPTINVNNLGAKNLVKLTSTGTTALVLGDIATNVIVLAEYDGGAFQMLSQLSVVQPLGIVGATDSGAISTSTNTDVTVTTTFTPKTIELTLKPSTLGDAGTYLVNAVYNQTTGQYYYGLMDQNGALTLADFSYATGNAVLTGTGGNNWVITVSILSVSTTSFVIRLTSVKTGSPSACTVSIGYKATSI